MTQDDNSNSAEHLQWNRGTPWKQGRVIPAHMVVQLGLTKQEPEPSCLFMVISHDCDLAEDDLETEPLVELLRAQIIPTAAPDFTHAKSPNTLDLDVPFEDSTCAIRLKAFPKLTVQKATLCRAQPDPRFILDEKSGRILQKWLASRYRRAALPDALHGHLSAIRRTLQEIGKKSPHSIIGFYLDHDPDEEIVDPENPYELWITVVYDHTVVGADLIASEAAKKIAARLEKSFKTDTGWRSIHLRSCQARSDREFSLYDAQTLKLYTLEHISLKHSARGVE